MTNEDIARVCHEANRALCQGLGDNSQLPWGEAPKWQVDSAIDGVNFHIKNPEATDSASHDNWVKGKIADGWKFGLTKDETKLEHPCMVPFNELPEEQQVKDTLFRSIVHALTALIN